MIFVADLGEMFGGGPVSLVVLKAGVTKHLGREGRTVYPPIVRHHLNMLVQGNGSVGVLDAQGALLHFFEAQGHDAIRQAAFDKLLGHEKSGGTRRAVVVDVVDGNSRVTQLVEGPFSTGGIAVAIAHSGLLDIGELNPGVLDRPSACLACHVGVVPISSAGFFEFRHSDTDDIDFSAHGKKLLLESLGESEARTVCDGCPVFGAALEAPRLGPCVLRQFRRTERRGRTRCQEANPSRLGRVDLSPRFLALVRIPSKLGRSFWPARG